MTKAAFSARVHGPLFTPEDAGYAAEIAGFNTAVTHTPALVVAATSAEDVVEAVRVAHELGLRLSVQGAGHGGLEPVRGGVLISTRRLDQVRVDPESRLATVGAGTRWSQVVRAASEHGLAPVCGSSTDVGVVGYLLGGGVGPLARSHGVSSDYVTSLRVVTGTGEHLEVSADRYPDLFWALRGGKFGLGIVTELTIRLVPLRTLYAGSLFFEEAHLERALRGYVDFTREAASSVTTSAAIIRFPDFEVVPPIFRGRRLLSVRFAYPGSSEEGERLARPLRSLAPVYLDDLRELAAVDVHKICNDPRDPMPSSVVAFWVGAIDQDFVTRWLAELDGDSPFGVAEIRHLGAATRVDVSGGSAVGGARCGLFPRLDRDEPCDLRARRARGRRSLEGDLEAVPRPGDQHQLHRRTARSGTPRERVGAGSSGAPRRGEEALRSSGPVLTRALAISELAHFKLTRLSACYVILLRYKVTVEDMR
jgi:hypothetical protein